MATEMATEFRTSIARFLHPEWMKIICRFRVHPHGLANFYTMGNHRCQKRKGAVADLVPGQIPLRGLGPNLLPQVIKSPNPKNSPPVQLTGS